MSPLLNTVSVPLPGTQDRSYEIHIGQSLLEDVTDICSSASALSHVVVITDDNVAPLYGRALAERFEDHGIDVTTISVAAGERAKSLDVANDIWNQMLSAGSTRATTIVAVGGGVVGDLAGFIAASFARGLQFVQVPTSLLAQVDSSVGGKVAINLPGAKNMVGFFWQPAVVLADLDTLDTLPDREYRAGLAEVVKYGVIADASLFVDLENAADQVMSRDKQLLADIVARCCQIKADVVAEDERETTGRRAILNYGHTVGHALEAVCGYGTLLHGEAIAIGMQCAACMAVARSLTSADFVPRQAKLLQDFGLPINPPEVDRQQLWEAITKDKKATAEGVRFILPTSIGTVGIESDIQQEEVFAALDQIAS